MDTKKERENEAGRITGEGIKTSGGWMSKCTIGTSMPEEPDWSTRALARRSSEALRRVAPCE